MDEFLVDRRAEGYTLWLLTTRAIAPLLVFLRSLGVIPYPPPPLPDTAADELIEIFRSYLAAERGLAELMVRRARSNPSHPRREPLFEPSGARPTT
jgi:hypothetical protein